MRCFASGVSQGFPLTCALTRCGYVLVTLICGTLLDAVFARHQICNFLVDKFIVILRDQIPLRGGGAGARGRCVTNTSPNGRKPNISILSLVERRY